MRVREIFGLLSADDRSPEIRIERPHKPLDPQTTEALRRAIAQCPDVAFAHLVDVQVVGQQQKPELASVCVAAPGGVSSLRAALNLVSEAVAGALPEDRFVDVLILNSAPELLEDVERADCLLCERDADERERAKSAMRQGDGEIDEVPRKPWWWPFLMCAEPEPAVLGRGDLGITLGKIACLDPDAARTMGSTKYTGPE